MLKRRATAARSSAGLDRSLLDPGLLDGILDDGGARAGGVRHAVLLSQDGTVLVASRGLSRRDAEHLAEIASGFHGLARSAGRRARPAPVRRTVIELESGTLFVAAAGAGTCLVVLSAAGTDPAVAAAETARLVERVGEQLRRALG
ncbi:roadblock/LC7 domain-containing protein [Streptomyces botrytidirepellens]|uniref:Roadblock/LC7 domain-containing protein n=1 Tax=Streptomyces botrytidirepellens TaxID=2486417 RepID=A0A3M8UR59_9ACTN|nr:roadblock/LC7 domain-containing protein [Streptomyces botrytidirepellens]RNG07762.1 roadblock/LC7 domain-containing protein [Streptomyces botrytidirepellens]